MITEVNEPNKIGLLTVKIFWAYYINMYYVLNIITIRIELVCFKES